MSEPEEPRLLDDPFDDTEKQKLKFRQQRIFGKDSLPTTPSIPPPPPVKGQESE